MEFTYKQCFCAFTFKIYMKAQILKYAHFHLFSLFSAPFVPINGKGSIYRRYAF